MSQTSPDAGDAGGTPRDPREALHALRTEVGKAVVGQDGVVSGLVVAMLIYNVGAAIVLRAAGIGMQPVGIALWPAVMLHAAMAGWCTACLLRAPRRGESPSSRPF